MTVKLVLDLDDDELAVLEEEITEAIEVYQVLLEQDEEGALDPLDVAETFIETQHKIDTLNMILDKVREVRNGSGR